VVSFVHTLLVALQEYPPVDSEPPGPVLVVRGLHPTTKDQHVMEAAQAFSGVKEVRVITDRLTNICKGFAFIEFYTAEVKRRLVKWRIGMYFKHRLMRTFQ